MWFSVGRQVECGEIEGVSQEGNGWKDILREVGEYSRKVAASLLLYASDVLLKVTGLTVLHK